MSAADPYEDFLMLTPDDVGELIDDWLYITFGPYKGLMVWRGHDFYATFPDGDVVLNPDLDAYLEANPHQHVHMWDYLRALADADEPDPSS